jgi:hypothetical protein
MAAEPVTSASPEVSAASSEQVSTQPSESDEPASPPPGRTPGPGGWFTSDVATGLIGIAENGEVIAGFPGPDGPEIRRLSPTGTLVDAVPWSKRALKTGTFAYPIDPGDGSIVAVAGYVRPRITRISSRTGEVTGTFRLRGRWMTPTIDADGRLYMVCQGDFDRCAYVLRRGSVGVFDRQGRKTAGRLLYDDTHCVFNWPAAMGRTTDGRIRARSHGLCVERCRSKDIRAVDVTTDIALGQSFAIPYEPGYPSYGRPYGVRDMTGTPDGWTYLVEMTRRKRDWQVDTYRLREIGPDGTVLRTWVHGGTEEGIENPVDVEVAPDGTLWVTDFDVKAKETSLRWLPPGS